MNTISGTLIYSKIKELVSSLPNAITPEVIDKLYEDDSMQPFLKWFYLNIKPDNVLSNECIQLKKHIKKNDTWLQGEELDLALANATKDCPDLLKLIKSDYWNKSQSFTDLGAEKELYDPDVEYLQSIEDSIKKLKECEEQLDNDLDEETYALKKEEIKVKMAYDDCISVLEDFDSCHRQFFNDVELLTNTYTDAARKKGEPCIWTQMPIDNYIKQLERYSDYLNSYAKRQFSMYQKDRDELNTDRSSFINENTENEKLNELICCQNNLFTSKIHEIIAKVEDDASKSLLNYVIEIYNDGNLKAPSTPVLARIEIAEISKSRDILEEDVNILQERQLVDLVQQFAKAKVNKVLEEEAKARLKRRTSRLVKLEKLCTLAKEHGYAFSTIFCMLLELQIHRINEIIQFVMDARHYLSMEYSLSSVRNSSMHKLQNEYESNLASYKDQNIFCQKFVEMIADDNLKDNMLSYLHYYNELRNDNNYKLKSLLDDKILEMIESSKLLEIKITDLIEEEINDCPTLSFRAIPCNIQNKIYIIMKQVEELETNVESMRNKLKSMIKESSVPNFEREKLLIWQKFLAEPESLQERCKKLEEMGDRSNFQ
ncbi:PREDICTED: uncharacterized protein LOC105362830 [Ceratosolen solmsi marchali]|uniref:Uncharacterized protein LOC105362830 n=1 Tax=Ceratosolen solmsi marchali TaxID=326594 RepID=A0AAJ7DW59_9HYME|nr:PREDICTED: uncharacterized protein LOC105362830 [Ceratosolen solmsi marchali]